MYVYLRVYIRILIKTKLLKQFKRIIYVGTFLSKGDSVVLQENDFEAVAHYRIVVDHLTNSCDETDDHFSCVVAWSSLGRFEQNIIVRH